MPRRKDPRKQKAVEMLEQGLDVAEVSRVTGLPVLVVQGLKSYVVRRRRGTFKSITDNLGSNRVQPPGSNPPGEPLGSNPGSNRVEPPGGGQGSTGSERGGGVYPPPKAQPEPRAEGSGGPAGQPELEPGGEAVSRELWLKATPIIRKIVLNPVVYLWYDYARNQLGYKGDIGDMLYDALKDFWESRGYKIKIVREEEVA